MEEEVGVVGGCARHIVIVDGVVVVNSFDLVVDADIEFGEQIVALFVAVVVCCSEGCVVVCGEGSVVGCG